MKNEEKFPTVLFLKCRQCDTVYTESLTGESICPKCGTDYYPARTGEILLQRQDLNGNVIFAMRGVMYRIGDLANLKTQLTQTFDDPNLRSLAFEFIDCPYLDSGMLNLLVLAFRHMASLARPTAVISRDEPVLDSLQAVNLDRITRVFPDRDSYLASLSLL